MRNFFARIRWKEILCFVLLAAIGIGAVVGISSALTNKEKKISATVFARGSIDGVGNYVESKRSVYTKDMIECQGLRIEADFDSLGTYQVFYYASDNTFLGATQVFDTNEDSIYERNDDFAIAKYCRVLYTPDVPKDDDGYIDEDFKIRFYNVLSYAKQINIFVGKEQNFSVQSISSNYENKAILYGEGRFDTSSFSFVPVAGCGRYVFNPLPTNGCDYVVMKVAKSTFNDDGLSVFNAANGEYVSEKCIVLQSNSEYAYVCYDISGYDVFYCTVDAWSFDALEIYLL